MTSHDINIFFSHEVEQLANQLTDHVFKAASESVNPLQPIQIIVPNANMQRYLQLFMAEQQGICANLEFPFLEKGLSQYLNLFEASPEAPLWSQSELTIKIYTFLSTPELMRDSAMEIINQYMGGEANELLVSRKKWQLAQRLAVLFVSYELQRPEMVMQWISGQPHFHHSDDQQLKKIETAERHIYQNIMQSNNQTGGPSLFQRFQVIDWSQVKRTEQSMHLFTPTRLSAFHRHLLTHLAKYLPVNIYQLNVCNEYWEDLTTAGEDAWLQRINSQSVHALNASGQVLAEQESAGQEVFFELDDEELENPLLKAWAKPGRESLRLFSQLEDDAIHLNVTYQPDWLEGSRTSNPTALHWIQDSILNRSQPQHVCNHTKQLNTLQFAVAPSIYREVQAVYNNILLNLQQNKHLQLTDIAVLVPDMDKYSCVIEQVFAEQDSQHPFQLRYSLIDSSVKTESLYAQAVLGLFDVLEHNFVRATVLKWLSNECVKQALSLTDEELAEWLNWLSRLGVYSHFNHLYEAPESQQLAHRFTWQQGLQRLRQSLVTEDALSLTHDTQSMGRLSWVIESLYHWQQSLQKPRLPEDWHQVLTQMTASFVAVPEGHNKEDQVRLALNASMEKLQHHAGQVMMSLSDIRYFIEQEFIHLSASKGNYLSGGLVCASLQPMRPIPFKVTYILGLDERSFPGELFQETLDLTQRSRRLGDINKVENMNYLFLETLMCSREKLYLSYVGQDLVKDETILPSSTWQQLHEYATALMDTQTLGIESYPISHIPLDSADLYQHQAPAMGADWLVSFAQSDYQKYQARQAYLKAQLSSGTSGEAVEPSPEISQENASEVINVQVQALFKFLENPVLSYLDQVGGSSQLIDDQVNIEHEPFQLDGLSRYQLFDAAVADYLAAINQQQAITLKSAIDEQYDQMSRQSQLPIDLFADLQELYDLAQESTFEGLEQELNTLQALPGPVVFGDGFNQRTAAQRLEPFTVTVNNQCFQLNGSWEGLYSSDGIISHQVVVTSSKGVNWSKVLIKPFLYWCLAQLDRKIAIAEHFQLHVVFRDKVNKYTFKPWSTGEISFSTASQIRTYLTELLVSFSQAELHNLPFDAVAGLKVSVDDKAQLIPYLGPKSAAKNAHFFAYEATALSLFEINQLQQSYEEKATAWIDKHSYYEMLQALDFKFDVDALATYRQRLMPLHVMVEAKLP